MLVLAQFFGSRAKKKVEQGVFVRRKQQQDCTSDDKFQVVSSFKEHSSTYNCFLGYDFSSMMRFGPCPLFDFPCDWARVCWKDNTSVRIHTFYQHCRNSNLTLRITRQGQRSGSSQVLLALTTRNWPDICHAHQKVNEKI